MEVVGFIILLMMFLVVMGAGVMFIITESVGIPETGSRLKDKYRRFFKKFKEERK